MLVSGACLAVERVAVSHNAPIRWSGWSPRPLSVDGRLLGEVTAGVWTVGRGYFATVGVPVHEGREFSESDDQSAPPRVVRQPRARQATLAQPVRRRQDAGDHGAQAVAGKPDPAIQERIVGAIQRSDLTPRYSRPSTICPGTSSVS